MSYHIAQDSEYVGRDYWRWWAWIEADDTELDDVKEVAWTLHPSFEQTRVVAKHRADKFRLETAGWGIFLLRAEVVRTDGERRLLTHNLQLGYPEPSGTKSPLRSGPSAQPRRLPRIYLSYSTQHSRMAAKLRAGLEQAGLEVLDQTQLRPGDPWSEAIRRMIEKSDAVVGLVGDDEISPSVSAELAAAVASAKPALALLASRASSAGLPSDVPTLQVDVNQLDPTPIANLLRSQKLD